MILKLVSKKDLPDDYTQLVINIANKRPVDLSKFEVLTIDSITSEFRDEVFQYGLTSLLTRQPINEELIHVAIPKTTIENIMINFLKTININDELIIVDPYFFASTKEDGYPALIQAILKPFSPGLKTIKIITSPDRNKIDVELKKSIENNIMHLNSNMAIEHKTSPEYHDRFWISASRKKGIITGSSLNGLGKKYAIIDILKETDVKDIVSTLEQKKLI